MKRNITMLILLLLGGIMGLPILQAQTYYYYRGERRPLGINEEKVVLLESKSDISEAKLLTSRLKSIPVERALVFEDCRVSVLNKAVLSGNERKMLQNRMERFQDEVSSGEILVPLYVDDNGDELISMGLINIRLRKQEDLSLLDTVAKRYGLERTGEYEYMPLWYTYRITDKTSKPAVDVANEIYETGWFEAAYPELSNGRSPFLCVSEPDFSKQWGLLNDSLYNVDISACEVWKVATGKGVKIAVLDCGIDKEHFDLKENMSSLSYDAKTGTENSRRYGYHGTHCAGIAAAAINGKGIAGVAPQATIMDVSLDTLPYSARVASGIGWAWKNGADVISCSWTTNKSDMVEESIDSALFKGRNGKGAVVVVASGNHKYEPPQLLGIIGGDYIRETPDVRYPANYRPEILTVGAIGKNGIIFSQSCYGKEVDVCAPGVRVYSTIPENRMKYEDGTSMAAPHVAGIAALMLELNPNLTGQEVRDIIEKTAKKEGDLPYKTTSGRSNGTWNEKYGYGLANAYAAVREACPVTSYTNKTITQNTTIKGCSVEISNVTVKKGAKLTIEATGSVIFGVGFVVEEGAEMKVVK